MSIVSFIFATIKKSDYMSPDSEYTEKRMRIKSMPLLTN